MDRDGAKREHVERELACPAWTSKELDVETVEVAHLHPACVCRRHVPLLLTLAKPKVKEVEDDEDEERDDFLDFLDAGRFLLRFEREFFVLERGAGAGAALAAAGAAGAPLELEEEEEEPREERRRLLTRSAAVSPTLLASTEPNAERLLPRFFLFLLPPTA